MKQAFGIFSVIESVLFAAYTYVVLVHMYPNVETPRIAVRDTAAIVGATAVWAIIHVLISFVLTHLRLPRNTVGEIVQTFAPLLAIAVSLWQWTSAAQAARWSESLVALNSWISLIVVAAVGADVLYYWLARKDGKL